MRRLIVAVLSALILLCISISTPQGRGLHSIRWTPLRINLLRVGSPAAASLRPWAPPAQAPASERGAAPSAQKRISPEPGKPVERKLSGGQSHSYKITMISGQYSYIVVEQRRIDVAVALFAPDGKKNGEVDGDWKVDDRATSELMKLFYQGLFGPERLRPAGALRQAQLSIWKQKQWREPYYCAAFVLQGEWK
jgi:hypothetical protein